ncbi:MAG: hypothetical protein KZQ65_06875 [Candidatus Thiodiazotropha sp. (ex Gloverina cf. vestifex)]|nr:hypothetical protein [Candidatus Thiodiazotropha sp. (ex Gloverina cf. vestifex)]
MFFFAHGSFEASERKRSLTNDSFRASIGNCQFTPNAEIHIIQIIREALSNIIRHADATRAGVALQCDQEGMVTVTVEDDGVGIDDQRDMMQHYGLPIMKERAECLGGDLSIVESTLGGTQIKLTFNINNSAINKRNQSFVEQLNNV